MSNRQLEELEEERFTINMAKIIGISHEELDELDWYLDTDESKDGLVYSQLLIFRDSNPKHILNRIKGLDDTNTLYLDPFVFDYPDDE